MSSLRLALGLFHREQLPAFYRCLGASWAPSRSVHLSSPSSSSSSGDKTGTDAAHGLPLDPEWAEMAKKQLKGADPQEKLTWRTPEVCSYINIYYNYNSCSELMHIHETCIYDGVRGSM